MLVQTSDATWQAYNTYGGNSLYSCTAACPPGNPQRLQGRVQGLLQPARSTHVAEDDRALVAVLRRVPDDPLPRAQRLRRRATSSQRRRRRQRRRCCCNHKLFISSGHDEYWSGRAARERRGRARRRREPRLLQRQRGVLEDALASQQRRRHRPRRTGRSSTYKDTHFDAADATRSTWTGTWRDPRFSPPADGGRPENALTGQSFIVNSGTSDITVPAAYRNLRLWRNTARREPRRRPDADARAGRQHARLRVGRRRRQRLPPARASSSSRRRRSSGVESFTDYGSTTQLDDDRDAPPDAVPRAERRAACSAPAPCSGPGASTHQRWNASGRRRRPTPTCSRRRSTCSPTWARSPRRCMSGLVAASRVDRHDRARPRRSRARRRRGDRRRRAGDDLRHRDRRRRRRRRRRRGLDRRRHDLAPGHRHDDLVLHAGSPTARRARRSRSRATDDSGNLESPRRRRHASTSAARARSGRPERRRRRPSTRRPERGRGRRQVQVRPRRHDHRHPLLQGRRPTPAPTSATCGRRTGTLLAHGDVHRRDAPPAGSR